MRAGRVGVLFLGLCHGFPEPAGMSTALGSLRVPVLDVLLFGPDTGRGDFADHRLRPDLDFNRRAGRHRG